MSEPDDTSGNAEQPHSAAAPAPSLKKAVLNSATWTLLGYGLSQLLKLVSTLILARLLSPADLGLMNLVFVFITGLHLFSDLGIGPAVVQSKRGDDPAFMNTAWTVQISRGLFLWLAAVVIAWPVARIYDDDPSRPSMLWMLPVVGLATAISGFNSTALYVLDRRLAQRRRVLFDLGISVVTLGVTVACAWVYRSVWALVAGNLASALLGMLSSHWLLHDIRNRLCWDRAALKEVFHFSAWVLCGSMLTFLGDKTDQLVIGKMSMALLGVYGISLRLVAIPTELMGSLNSQLVFPLYSRVLQGGRGQREAFAHIHPGPAGFAALLITGLLVTGPTFVRLVFDHRYEAAAWMVPLLAVGAWFQILEHTGDSFMWALGRAHVSAISNGVRTLSLPLLAALGYWLGDLQGQALEGMIVGFVSTQLVRYAVTAWFIHRLGMPVFRCDLLLTVLIGAIGALGWYSGPQLWPERMPHDRLRLYLQLGTQALVVVACWAALLGAAWARGLIRTSWRPAEEQA